MDFLETIKNRKSIRTYNDKAISKEVINTLLECAILAPSAGNSQPWHFFVIKEKNSISQISDASGTFVKNANVVIVVCANKIQSNKYYGKRGKTLYCYQDTAAAIENILLCATSQNLGACWCGDFKEKKIKKILNINKGLKTVAIISLGYYDIDATPRTTRVPLEAVTTYIE